MILEIKRGVDWRELSGKLFCIGFFALSLYLVFKYALGALVPFFIAYLVSLVIDPQSSATARVTGLPRKLCAAVYVTLFIAALLAAVFLGARRLVVEVEGFILAGDGIDRVSQILLAAREKASVLASENAVADTLGEWFFGFVAQLEGNIVSYVGESLPRLVSGAVSRAPSIFIGTLVGVMSCYYFCVDGARVSAAIKKAIPVGYREWAERFAAIIGTALRRYMRAYLFLMLLTFCEVYVGLTVLRVKYVFLIAAGIALVDILPILGAGTVIVPWALICLFSGEVQLGVGLLILYGALTIVRQIAEPAVVGSSVGINGAVSLFCMYAGFKLFGFVGMIIGPLFAFVVSETTKAERQPIPQKIKSRTRW